MQKLLLLAHHNNVLAHYHIASVNVVHCSAFNHRLTLEAVESPQNSPHTCS